jgi:hypothetical protein
MYNDLRADHPEALMSPGHLRIPGADNHMAGHLQEVAPDHHPDRAHQDDRQEAQGPSDHQGVQVEEGDIDIWELEQYIMKVNQGLVF